MKNQRKLGVILSYVSETIQVLSGLFYVPVMLRIMGQSEYGLYQLVYSVISYLSLFSLGFSGAYVRFYSRYKVKENEKDIAKLNGMFMTIFIVIAIVASICGVILTLNCSAIFGDGLTDTELHKAKILMLIMTFNLAITFISTVFSCIITAKEEFVFQKTVLIIKEICSPLITLPLLILGFGSIGMVSVTTFLSLTAITLNVIFCLKKLKTKFDFKRFDFKLLKEMSTFTIYIFINQIIDQINWSVDKFLLGRIMGTVAVAVYGVASQINTMYLRFSTSISNVFAPKVNMIVAKEENDRKPLNSMMVKIGRIQFIVLALVLSGFIVFGKEFIAIWAGKEYVEAFYITLLLIVPVTVPLIQNLGIDIQRAMNKHKTRSLVYLLIAIVNIFISIPLIKYMGASGAALGTAIGLFLGNILFMNIYYQKVIKLDMITFWKEISTILFAVIIPMILGVILNYVWPDYSILSLIIKIILYTIVYVIALWKISLNEYEKELLLNPIRKYVAKK